MLEEIAEKHCEYSIKLAAILPGIEIRNVTSERIDTETVRISAMIGNNGYLPTYLTDQAKSMNIDEEITVELESAQHFEILNGRAKEKVGHLEGRSNRNSTWSQWIPQWKPSVKRVSWLIKCKKGSEFSITARNNKSGYATEAIIVD